MAERNGDGQFCWVIGNTIGDSTIERDQLLERLQGLIEPETDVAVIVWTDGNAHNFIEDRQDVVERADRLKWWRLGRTEDTSSCRQNDGILDGFQRNATVKKLSGQETIIAADEVGGAGHVAIVVQDLLVIFVFGHVGRCSALRIA